MIDIMIDILNGYAVQNAYHLVVVVLIKIHVSWLIHAYTALYVL